MDLFGLSGRVAIITGGAGLLGMQHAEAIGRAGGIPVLLDINAGRANSAADRLSEVLRVDAGGYGCDIIDQDAVRGALQLVLDRYGRVDILINNAANNPKLEATDEVEFSRFEHFTLEQWTADVGVGLTGAFVCSQVFGTHMAGANGGVIVNVASDLALIGPDQRIYQRPGRSPDQQPVKPVTYSVVKAGLLGLTRYLATYWADRGVRVNAISPGGVYNGQPDEFVQRLENLIPMARMANLDEYQGAIIFLCSDASSYMTGANLVVDGGRTAW